jgi:penicillin-binding protein 1C
VGPYVLGVWIGNFDGKPNPSFIGRDAAGPLLFSIIDALAVKPDRAREFRADFAAHGPLNLKQVEVCALSGDLPGPHCAQRKQTWFIPGKSPIKSCSVHREVLIDPDSGLRLCHAGIQGARREVFEFWPSDILKVFSMAGLTRRIPPPYHPACSATVAQIAAPQISSPRRGLAYSLGPHGEAQIPFSAVTGSEYVGTSDSKEAFFWKARPGNFSVRAVDEHGLAAVVELRVVL